MDLDLTLVTGLGATTGLGAGLAGARASVRLALVVAAGSGVGASGAAEALGAGSTDGAGAGSLTAGMLSTPRATGPRVSFACSTLKRARARSSRPRAPPLCRPASGRLDSELFLSCRRVAPRASGRGESRFPEL